MLAKKMQRRLLFLKPRPITNGTRENPTFFTNPSMSSPEMGGGSLLKELPAATRDIRNVVAGKKGKMEEGENSDSKKALLPSSLLSPSFTVTIASENSSLLSFPPPPPSFFPPPPVAREESQGNFSKQEGGRERGERVDDGDAVCLSLLLLFLLLFLADGMSVQSHEGKQARSPLPPLPPPKKRETGCVALMAERRKSLVASPIQYTTKFPPFCMDLACISPVFRRLFFSAAPPSATHVVVK